VTTSLKLFLFAPAAALAFAPGWCCGQTVPALEPADLAQRHVIAYVAKLADIHCNESVVQEKLAANGHVEATERSNYDYLIMVGGTSDDFQLNESRIAAGSAKHKQLPMLVTAGFSTILLIFHPYYRNSFEFTAGDGLVMDGRAVIPIKFSQIPGRRSPAALALRGREYPLDLEGTAWIDERSGQIVQIDAALERDMSDVGLRSLSVHSEYKPTRPGKDSAEMMLPSTAVVDVQTPRQHWRNTHTFDGYKSFLIEAEQDPKVKINGKTAEELQRTEQQKDGPEPKPDPNERR